VRTEDLQKTPEYQQFWEAIRATDRLDLWALKIQVYLELRLKHLLALRLGVSAQHEEQWTKQIETINYHHLVQLALPHEDTLRDELVKLNNVRKEVAHKFQTTSYLKHLKKFAESVRSDDPWPQTPEEQFAYVRTALAVVVTSVEFVIRDVEQPGWDDESTTAG
jgi:hypothetical protein